MTRTAGREREIRRPPDVDGIGGAGAAIKDTEADRRVARSIAALFAPRPDGLSVSLMALARTTTRPSADESGTLTDIPSPLLPPDAE